MTALRWFFLYILLYCITHWTYDAGLSRCLKIGREGARINMVGMIWPPGWDRVNWFAKTGKGGRGVAPLPQISTARPFGCGSSIPRLRGNHISMLTDEIWYESYFDLKLLLGSKTLFWNILQYEYFESCVFSCLGVTASIFREPK